MYFNLYTHKRCKDRKFVFLDLGMISFIYQYNEMISTISLVFISVWYSALHSMITPTFFRVDHHITKVIQNFMLINIYCKDFFERSCCNK